MPMPITSATTRMKIPREGGAGCRNDWKEWRVGKLSPERGGRIDVERGGRIDVGAPGGRMLREGAFMTVLSSMACGVRSG